MVGFSISVVLQAALAAGAQNYEEAFQETQSTGRPLMVLVGADWCPACRIMKHSTLEGMANSGKLNQVVYTVVNTDDQPLLAEKLMRGRSIPQLILFSKAPDGWRRSQATGAINEREVDSLIRRAIGQTNLLASDDPIAGK